MCTREMTLGEEIINLTKRGIDVPTVERMYRKYIDLDEKGKSEGCYAIDLGPLFPTFDIGDTVRYCRADVEATLNLFRDTVHNPYSILPADIKVGDKMMVPLGKLGNFTATVQKVTNNKVLFIFDDYVAKRPMNEDGGNAGGYSQSDLKKWIDTELYDMFPAVLKQRMTGLSIPTLGEICGWADKWDRDHIEADGDEQLPLMKQRRKTEKKDKKHKIWKLFLNKYNICPKLYKIAYMPIFHGFGIIFYLFFEKSDVILHLTKR